MTSPALPIEPSAARYPDPLARYLAATRPAFLTATLVACLLGLASARYGGVRLDPLLATATVTLALLVTNLLYINQFPDRTADAAAGKRHWVVRLPVARAALGYPLVAAAALVALLVAARLGALPAAALFSALPLLLSARAALLLRRHAATPAQLLPVIKLTLAAMLAHGVLLAGILWLEATT